MKRFSQNSYSFLSIVFSLTVYLWAGVALGGGLIVRPSSDGESSAAVGVSTIPSPELQLSMGAQYRWEIGQDGEVYLRLLFVTSETSELIDLFVEASLEENSTTENLSVLEIIDRGQATNCNLLTNEIQISGSVGDWLDLSSGVCELRVYEILIDARGFSRTDSFFLELFAVFENAEGYLRSLIYGLGTQTGDPSSAGGVQTGSPTASGFSFSGSEGAGCQFVANSKLNERSLIFWHLVLLFTSVSGMFFLRLKMSRRLK